MTWYTATVPQVAKVLTADQASAQEEQQVVTTLVHKRREAHLQCTWALGLAHGGWRLPSICCTKLKRLCQNNRQRNTLRSNRRCSRNG